MKKIISAFVVLSVISAVLAIPVAAKNDKTTKKPVTTSVQTKVKENRGLHLGQIKNGKIENSKFIVSTSTLAFRAAVQSALANYDKQVKGARQTLNKAIQQARNQYFGTGTTTPVAMSSAPTVATAAAANPAIVTGTSTVLSVLGNDDKGEANLKYTWSTIAKPDGAADPVFSVNSTNTAKTVTVTFSKPGNYQFLVVISDEDLFSVYSSVGVSVVPTIYRVQSSPQTVTVYTSSTYQLVATSTDQFGGQIASGFNWSILEGAVGGSINSSGLYTASTTTGTFHAIVTSNVYATKISSSTINVISP